MRQTLSRQVGFFLYRFTTSTKVFQTQSVKISRRIYVENTFSANFPSCKKNGSLCVDSWVNVAFEIFSCEDQRFVLCFLRLCWTLGTKNLIVFSEKLHNRTSTNSTYNTCLLPLDSCKVQQVELSETYHTYFDQTIDGNSNQSNTKCLEVWCKIFTQVLRLNLKLFTCWCILLSHAVSE